MVAVNVIDGVKYGFRLLGYLLAVFIVGGILLGIAGSFAPGPFNRGNPILMVIFGIAGLAILYAGGLGLMYKVIADGVETGTLSAERGGGSAGGGLTSFGSSGGSDTGNRQRAQQARQQAQQPAQGGGQATGQQGGQPAQQGGRGGNQAGGSGGHQGGQSQSQQGQQPPQDWEPGN